jgi:hypothetical protein
MASWHSTKGSLYSWATVTQRRTRPLSRLGRTWLLVGDGLETITKEHRLDEIHHCTCVWLPLPRPSTNSSKSERSESCCLL